MRSNFSLKIEAPAKIFMLRPLGFFVRSLIEQLADNCDASEVIDRVELAFSEAFTNICRHAYGVTREGPVIIEIKATGDQLTFVFTDFGQGFDPDSVAPPNLDEPREGGLGLWLMKQVMDEYAYQSEPDGRNVLTLKKNIAKTGAASSKKT